MAAMAALLLAAGCRSQRPAGLDPSRYEGKIRVACIGDSITYGAGIEDRESHSYPAVLGQLLGERFEVRNFGVSGATLLKNGDHPYWTQPEFEAATRFGPDVVIIKLGTNDSKPQNWKRSAEFARDLTDMLVHFERLPSRPRIWLCLPVPAYEERWGINDDVIGRQVIPLIVQVADKKHVPVIDLYDALSGRPDLFPDKIHPDAAGAKRMAQTIRDALLAVR